MLVSFAVQNYLSIRDRLEVSFLAATGNDAAKEPLPQNYTTQILNNAAGKAFPLLKSAIIYGANASGKTNILLALRNFIRFIQDNYADDDAELPLMPFFLDADSKNAPIEFEVTLLLDGTLYRYGLSVDRQSVLEEWLFAADKGKERCLFTREKKPADKGYNFHFGPTAKTLLRPNASQVRPNSLLLTHASLNNEPTARRILSFLKFVKRRDNEMRTVPQLSTRHVLLEALKMIDIGLHDLQFKKLNEEAINASIENITFPNDMPEEFKAQVRKHICEDLKEEKIFFLYTDNTGNDVPLHEGVQSDGTRNLFSLLAYLLNNASTPQVLIIDEVEKSLHPLLLHFFFQLFHALPNTGIQLLCSTHNTHILHEDIFRRDQIYIAEKGRDHATTIKSLADYAGLRQGINVGKYYLEGRFGGIPILSSGDIHRFVAQLEQVQQEGSP